MKALSPAVAEDLLGQLADGDLLAEQERVEVGDDDLGARQLLAVKFRHDVELAVVVLWIVGQQDAQAIADGDAGRDDQEGIGKAVVLRLRELVEGVPCDQHRHHDGLAAAGGHLERDAGE